MGLVPFFSGSVFHTPWASFVTEKVWGSRSRCFSTKPLPPFLKNPTQTRMNSPAAAPTGGTGEASFLNLLAQK